MSHWGPFAADVDACGEVTAVRPDAVDPAPSPLLGNFVGALRHPLRVAAPMVRRGWLERARRLLDEAGPCVEWGYWELARLACDRPDVVALEQAADRALYSAKHAGGDRIHVASWPSPTRGD